jgi:YD repeat-containing protein
MWLLDLFDRNERTEGTPSTTTVSEHCFDKSDGFLLGVRRLVGSSPSGKDVVTVFTPETVSSPVVMRTGNIAFERNYGADSGAAGTAPPCAAPASPPQYVIRNSYERSSTGTTMTVRQSYCSPPAASGCTPILTVIDADVQKKSGLPTLSRDAAGLRTKYEYDDRGRLKTVTPLGLTSTSAVAAPTTYTYNTATFPHSVNITTSGTSGSTTSQLDFDSMGRVARTMSLSAAGDEPTWPRVDVQYDGLGRKARVSEPYLPGQTPVYTTYEYDALGRPTRVRAPTGALSRFEYKGARETKRVSFIMIGNQQKEVAVTETSDAQGRLYQVTENSGPSNAAVVTTYTYDGGSRLTGVEMKGAESGAPVQVRSFKYDNRGFLLQEIHPESARVYYSGYDARGHASLRTFNDPALGAARVATPHDLRFTFDAAERLVGVEAQHPALTTESFLNLKAYSYATANGTAAGGADDYTKGKLLSATRWNYHPDPDIHEADVFEVHEIYAYVDPAGRRTARMTQIRRGDTAGTALVREVKQGISYNDLGLVSEIQYPRCVGCLYSATASVSLDYLFGRLRHISRRGDQSTSIYNVATLDRWPGGMVKSVDHGNGMRDEVATDVMSRPKRMTAGEWLACTRPVPSVTAQPSTLTINAGQTIKLTATATGTAPFDFTWFAATTGGSWSQVGTGVELIVTPSETTSYFVEVVNACSSGIGGAPQSAPLTVTVVTCVIPAVETLSDIDQVVPAGSSFSLSVRATGTAPLSYAWYDAANLTTVLGTGPNLDIASISRTTSYFCRVSNACGSSESAAFVITVPLPSPRNFSARYVHATSAIELTWDASAGASRYQIERKANGGGFSVLPNTVTATSFVDGGRPAGVTYVYRVLALDGGGGSASPASVSDLATTLNFTSVTSGNPVTIAPVLELMSALQAVYAAVGWPAPTWATILPTGVPAPVQGGAIGVAHLQALRERFDQALGALGIARAAFADNPIRSGQTVVRAEQIREVQRRAQ